MNRIKMRRIVKTMKVKPRINKIDSLDVNKCLAPELTIGSVDDILYRIGLCLTSVRVRPKRLWIYNPLIIFIFVWLILIREVFAMFISEDNDLLLKILGNLGYFVSQKQLFGMAFISLNILVISSQIIFYYNYKNGIKPTFLYVFQMMSGLVPPKSLGLTNEKHIFKLVTITKNLVKIISFYTDKIMPAISLLTVNGLYLINGSPYELIFYGVPNSIVMIFWTHFVWIIILNQFLEFYIICVYFKIKINSLNESLLEMQRKNRFIRIRETLQSINSLHLEINEYNTSFWSKFLCIFWLSFGSYIVIFSGTWLFGKQSFLIKLAWAYCSFISIIGFLFVIFTASSVNYCANNSYKILNSVIISYSKHNKHFYYLRISTKLKVNMKQT